MSLAGLGILSKKTGEGHPGSK